MRIAIITDAWLPQVNGVVRTLQAVRRELEAMGHEVTVIAPDGFQSLPCPSYPEIRLALATPGALGRRIEQFDPDAVHLVTEGPLCVSARRWCLARGVPFTTAYHTHFPDYVSARTGINPAWIWRYIRWFHAPAQAVLASTPRLCEALAANGLPQARRWGRGVDLSLFSPDGERDPAMAALPGPVQLYVGRVAVEKNLDAFLGAATPGSKVVIGDGPALAARAARHPDAHFLGPRSGAALAAVYRTADVFVFPSRTDTFGLVMVEALASGVPVAAFPVAGPLDVLAPDVGVMDASLAVAIEGALRLDPITCRTHAAQFDWHASAREFLDALVVIDQCRRAA